MSTSLIKKDDQAKADAITAVLDQVTPTALGALPNDFARTLALSRGMIALRKALGNDTMQELASLAGSPVGFLVDRDNYTQDQLRDALLEGLILGARPIGGEIVVINARAFLSKVYWYRMLTQLEGFTDFHCAFKGCNAKDGGAVVALFASWKWFGEPMHEDWTGETSCPVRLNKGQGVDAARGKAEARIYRSIYRRLTGTVTTGRSVDEAETETVDGSLFQKGAPDAGGE